MTRCRTEEPMVNIRGVVLAGALLALAGCATTGASQSSNQPVATPATGDPAGGQVRVAAASDLRFAMDELATTFSATNPDLSVEPTYGSSGTFFAQISEGAPFDLFFSADAAYPRSLETAGLAARGSTQVYGIGQLVLWVPEDSAIDIEGRGLEALADPAVGSVAIANPEHAPYGRAAEAALQWAGIYDAVRSKLVLGENVAQAAQFVESGSADAGLIAHSLAVAPELRDKGRFVIIPADAYPRLEQGAVVLASAADPDAARAFLDFVLGPEGRAVLDRYGFLLPGS